MSSPKTIEINGVKYNAATGNLLADEVGAISTDTEEFAKYIEALDDLPIRSSHKPEAKPAPKARKVRRQPVHISDVKRHPQKSTTLMRPAVKKPAHKSEATATEKPKPLIRLPDDKERERRAKHIPKSKKIARFHFREVDDNRVNVRVMHDVRPMPVKVQDPPPANNSIVIKKTTPEHHEWPVIDQFEKAMQEASSHLETFVDTAAKAKKKRKFAYASISLFAMVLLGLGAYQALPLAKIKMAGNKAGFAASLPKYSPSGYGMADPQADYGKVTLPYKSRTDDKDFKIVQEPSKWNSQALISDFLVTTDKKYQTIKGGGRTIYTYDNTNATWVDGGVWYKLEGNANL
ncbi:MAG TPA: hypothetical protein VFW77_00325, partial [Candidatus Saccharimonadales bacterium]|nr:hypothetical protein [Candidatus Saccharimonadales bacterium]